MDHLLLHQEVGLCLPHADRDRCFALHAVFIHYVHPLWTPEIPLVLKSGGKLCVKFNDCCVNHRGEYVVDLPWMDCGRGGLVSADSHLRNFFEMWQWVDDFRPKDIDRSYVLCCPLFEVGWAEFINKIRGREDYAETWE